MGHHLLSCVGNNEVLASRVHDIISIPLYMFLVTVIQSEVVYHFSYGLLSTNMYMYDLGQLFASSCGALISSAIVI